MDSESSKIVDTRTLLGDDKYPVRLGDLIFTQSPDKYHMLGIGTCLGIFMYDMRKKFFCLAHTVLPKYSEARYNPKKMPGKFTDLTITLMVEKMIKNKCEIKDIKCKIVGGSQIYEDSFKIGEKNIEIAKKELSNKKIPLISSEVGGTESRSILSFNNDGTINIRKKGKYFII